MADIMKPDAPNERFTIYLNADGKPVQRPLREMTPDEVLKAMEWHHAEADRCVREAEPAKAVAIAMAEGRRAELANMTRQEWRAAMTLIETAEAASARAERLISLVLAQCPPRYENTPFNVGLRRWWPGGRHAA